LFCGEPADLSLAVDHPLFELVGADRAIEHMFV
jgi:hypothetical protein